jgi:3D (Asp-Asp-Asp) domain-containing protein
MRSLLPPITLLPCFLLLPFPVLAAITAQSTPVLSSRQQTRNSVARWQGDWLRIDRAPTRGIPLNLWATFYYVHQTRSIPYGLPLLDPAGNHLGPNLSRWDWCHAALQGTVIVHEGHGQSTTYNFAGRSPTPQVDCSPFFSSLSWEAIAKVNRVRFQVATAPYGYGTAGFKLVPYRTVAVDRTQIPLGSVLYIPQARGRTVTMPSGQWAIHDGYFFAADVGSAIHGNHIDVFIGTAERNPFPFITSRPSGTFQAFFIQDADIAQALQALHQRLTEQK